MADNSSLEERIGGVRLDYSKYPGEDFYCDGDVEQDLLDIVTENSREEYRRIIRERKDWPTLYHLSSIRGNIVDWIPFTGNERVLEIGAGPGAITQTLCTKVKEVTCVELSSVRSRINANRNRDHDNITILVGNFQDIEPTLPADYDYIFLIGVFEYAKSYIGGERPFHEELNRILAHLAPNGRLVMAIENRLGMKYFAGCREDHTGRYFDGIENYPDQNSVVHTFSRSGLEKIFKECGVEKYSFYYPYPDYKFMHTLFSDQRLPMQDELTDNIRNFDRDRMLLFDEKKAYQGVLEEGVYPTFSNSYEVVIGPELPVCYAKYSNDRAERFAIRTEYVAGNPPMIRKSPFRKEATAHVQAMAKNYKALAARFEGSKLSIAPCTLDEKGNALFTFIVGTSLEHILDQALKTNNFDQFYEYLDGYFERISFREEMPIADYDMTFSNILIEGDTWTAIDYEWALERAISGKELMFRALLCFRLENEKRRERMDELISFADLIARYGITQEEREEFEANETAFQQYVTNGRESLGELRAELGAKVIVPTELIREDPILMEEERLRLEAIAKEEERKRKEAERPLASAQVYLDGGKGYSESESYWVEEPYREEGMLTFEVTVPGNVSRLRIDPALCPCITLLKDVRLKLDDCDPSVLSVFEKGLVLNGTRYKDGSMVYVTSDPHMEWNMKDVRGRIKHLATKLGNEKDSVRESDLTGALTFEVTLQMCGLPSTMAAAMSKE